MPSFKRQRAITCRNVWGDNLPLNGGFRSGLTQTGLAEFLTRLIAWDGIPGRVPFLRIGFLIPVSLAPASYYNGAPRIAMRVVSHYRSPERSSESDLASFDDRAEMRSSKNAGWDGELPA